MFLNEKQSIRMALMLTLWAGPPLPAGEVRGVWRPLASMPGARQEVGVAEAGGQVYVIGGLAPGAATSRVDVYSPQTNSWRTVAPLPLALHHVAAAAAGDRVYSIGGFLGFSFRPSTALFEFDPTTGQWSERAPLPVALGALAAGTIDGRIYAVGGTEANGADSSRLFVYDPAADQWTALSPMPTPRNHLAAGVIDGRLYVVGGRSPNRATLEVYDPASDSWESRPPMPTARSGLAAAVFGGLLFVFGGEIPGVFDETEVYDPDSNSWFSLTPMAIPRHGIGAAVIDNRIIIPGGAVLEGLGATALSDEFAVLSQVTALAQFADGPDIVSRLVLSYFGGGAAASMVELRDDQGQELGTEILETAPPENGLVLETGQSARFSSSGDSNPTRQGSVLVFSDRPVLAHILFSSPFGFAGVLGRPTTQAFAVPVESDLAANLNSGVALSNATRFTNRVTLRLLEEDGSERASAFVDLPPYGQTADFIDELFPGTDLSRFQGSVAGEAERPVGAMAILQRGNQMATLPVQTEGVGPGN